MTTGIVTAAKSAVQLILGYFIGAYIGKTGRVKLVMVATSIVYAVSNFILGFTSTPADMVLLIVGILLSGLGTTTYSMVYTLHAQNELPSDLVGEATSAIQFLQSLSGTIGLSVVGMVLNTSFSAKLQHVVPAGLEKLIPADQLQQYLGTTLLTDPTAVTTASQGLAVDGQQLFTQFVDNLHNAYACAMTNAFLVLGVLCAITLIFSLMVRPSKKKA